MSRKLVFNLRDSKFSNYHRAGLAGLVVSLRTLSTDTIRHSASELTLTIEYDVSDLEAWDLILRHAFVLDRDGQALGRGLFTHIGFTETLLQIPALRKLLEKTSTHVGELEYYWFRLAAYRHQSVAEKLVNNKGGFKKGALAVKAWMLPGATGGHYCEDAETLLPLLFAPLIYSWFDVYSHTTRHAGKALVVPRIETFGSFVPYSPETPLEWHTSSIAEAALNYSLKTNLACEAKLFGPVAWDKHQKHVREKVTVHDLNVLDTWREVHGFTQSRIGELPDGKKIITTSAVREMTAHNLLAGKPLYMDLVRYHDRACFEVEACRKLCQLVLAA